MQGVGFFAGFFILLIILALNAGEGGFFNGQSGSESERTTRETTISGGSTAGRTTPTPSPRLSDEEVEQKLVKLYRELDGLQEDLREATLREPASPYTGMVTLRIGNAKRTNPEEEYLTLLARSNNTEALNISDWFVESYVTEERAAIPEGARILKSQHGKETAPIYLEPGERAYLITSESPFNISFRENNCTGYLSKLEDVYPRLTPRCPDPEAEMLRFARIDLDNDSCYEFVEDINRCEIIDEDDVDEADISGACKKFVNENLNYEGCVENHRSDLQFDELGYWRIYFDRERDPDDEDEDQSRDLWRKEREIIRLIDERDRVVDVIEY